jgi:hypothetical protein
MRKLPYSPRPPSQFRTPPFYWRANGDDFKQQEYLISEYRRCLMDNQRAQTHLQELQAEFKRQSETLGFRSDQSLYMSSFTSPHFNVLNEDDRLHQELAALQGEIAKKEEILDQMKARAYPPRIRELQRERIAFKLEIERLKAIVHDTTVLTDDITSKQVLLALSQKYDEGLSLEFLVDKLRKKRSHLKTVVSDQMEAMEYFKPPFFDPLQDLRELRHILKGKVRPKVHCGEWTISFGNVGRNGTTKLGFCVDALRN